MSLHASSKSSGENGPWWIVAVVTCILASAAVAGVAVAGAAGGFGSPTLAADDRSDDADLLVVEGPANDTAHYGITVDGTLEPADKPGGAVEPGELDDARAEGTVNGTDADAYRLTGEVTSATVAGNVTLLVDGREITPENLSDGWAVTFANCSTVDVAGNFAEGFAFSTVVFSVRGPEGDLAGYEETPVNERLAVADRTARLRAGTTLPEDVSEIAALRSVFLYEGAVDAVVDPLLLESEVATQVGEPPVRVENPAHESCRGAIEDRHADGTVGDG